MRGYFGIGIYQPKNSENVGTLWRSAHNMGAAFIFTIGHRYKRQCSDTTSAWRHLPLFNYEDFDSFKQALPLESLLLGVEQAESAEDLRHTAHPERAVYLLGAEDHGLPALVLSTCHRILEIPSARCLNVAVCGSIVMYDRLLFGTSPYRTLAKQYGVEIEIA